MQKRLYHSHRNLWLESAIARRSHLLMGKEQTYECTGSEIEARRHVRQNRGDWILSNLVTKLCCLNPSRFESSRALDSIITVFAADPLCLPNPSAVGGKAGAAAVHAARLHVSTGAACRRSSSSS